MPATIEITAADLAELVSGELTGPGEVLIRGLEAVDRAGEGDLTFIADDVWASNWPQCGASAALVSRHVELPQASHER